MKKTSTNPLSNLMRKPKLQISLPSKGQFWKESSIELSEDNLYSVFSATARDKMILKNPALIANGQSIVDVVKSCVPAIKNPWDAPSIDIDTLMVAIKIASDGPELKDTIDINGTECEYTLNLEEVLDQLDHLPIWDNKFELEDGIVVYIKPASYKSMAKLGQEAIETQKIFDVVNDDTANEEKKIEVFKNSFSKLTDLTLSFVQDCVYRIEAEDQIVNDPSFINEFIENCESKTFTKIKDRIDELSSQFGIKSLKIPASEEMLAAGSEKEVEINAANLIAKFFSGDLD